MDTHYSELFQLLKKRFEKNKNRHASLDWSTVQQRIEAHPDKLKSLFEMEATGGEPDLVAVDKHSGELIFLIAQQKAQKVVVVCVMTLRHWMPERSISQSAVQQKWLRLWGFSCLMKTTIVICSSSALLTAKAPVG